MHPTDRREKILKQLQQDGKVEINQLSEQFDVSPMTIRRDLRLLEDEKQLLRVNAGAVLIQPLITETPFSTKENIHLKQKKHIARKALSFIHEHQVILLDSGTTTLEIAKLLTEKNDLTVITNDIKIAGILMESNLKVIVTGGELQKDVGALFGPQSLALLKQVNVDVFFLGAHAIDFEAGITSPTFEKSMIKQHMMNVAEAVYLVADSSKLHQKSFSKVCDLNTVSAFITDDELAPNDKKRLSEVIRIY